MRLPRFFGVVLVSFVIGCARVPVKQPLVTPPAKPLYSLIKLSEDQFPMFEDDADTASLRTAALHSAAYYRGRPTTEKFNLAGDTYTAAEFAESLRYFVDLIDATTLQAEWQAAVRQNFNVYQSIGSDSTGTVTFSSYYEPTIPARKKKSKKFRYPIYGRPRDLIEADLGQFDPAFPGARIAGRVKGQNLVPYPTRGEIDNGHHLWSHSKVIAWAQSPTDIFFLQIEGSGWLDLGGGKHIRIRYDGTNGRKYASVGLHVINSGRIPKEQFTHDSFERYLETHPKEHQSLLNINPRYVFFRLDESPTKGFAYGNIEVPLTPYRSVATDPKIFPKGALAWMETDRPLLDEDGKKTGITSVKRFIVSQDEGGAIQGPGRVDYFVGDGLTAHRFATNFWQKGTLYFLVKKKPMPPADPARAN